MGTGSESQNDWCPCEGRQKSPMEMEVDIT